MVKKVSVVIVNWNGEKYIKKCIASLLNTQYENYEILVIDNGSTDNSLKIIKENFGEKVRVIVGENIGYAGGANKGILESNGEYVLIANPDIIFTEEYVKKLVDKLEEDSNNSAAIGKLLKYDFDNNKVLNFIDSAGIRLNHNRQGCDIGQNDEDKGQYEETRRVFGVCVAAALFKREALDNIRYENEFFDNDFFAYKEDIDLCWRLNLYGYKCFYVHNAIAYHGRGMNSSKGIINTIKNRRNQSEFLKGISFRNHYLMLTKNEVLDTYKKDKIGISLDYLKYVVFFVLFDFKCLKYINQIKELKPKMVRKRNEIMRNVKIDNEEIYKLFDL